MTKNLPEYLYQLQGMAECKTKLAQDKNLVKSLRAKGFELPKMWSRLDIAEQVNLPKNNLLWGVEHVLTD